MLPFSEIYAHITFKNYDHNTEEYRTKGDDKVEDKRVENGVFMM